MPVWLAVLSFLMGIIITAVGAQRGLAGQGWGLALVGVAIMLSSVANQVRKAKKKGEQEE